MMFFSGDASSRKRVDLGGRSSKERDRNKLLEQTRLERQRRLGLRLQNAAATKIQKCFRGRKSVAVARLEIREQFISSYGGYCQNSGMNFFSPHSTFFRQLLFFFRASNHGDFDILLETCRKLLQLVRDGGDLIGIMADNDYKTNHAVVDYRIKQFSYFCLQAVHQNSKEQLRAKLLYAINAEAGFDLT